MRRYSGGARFLQRILLAAATHARAAKTEQGRKFEDRSHGFRFLWPWRVGSGWKEEEVTENSSVKKAARKRMEETGEKYTEARRTVLAERVQSAGPTGSPSVGLKLEPETLTAVIGGGGMTNLALVMPWLVRCADEGRRVVVAANEGRLGPWGTGSPFDFLIAGGKVSREEFTRLWASEDEADRERSLALVDSSFPSVSFASGPLTSSACISALAPSEGGKPSVFLVPDLQVDQAVSDWPSPEVSAEVSDFELLPTQATGLRRIARQAKAIVVGCHCASTGDEEGWGLLKQIADESVVLSDDLWDAEKRVVPAKLEFHSRWTPGIEPTHSGSALIDTSFSEWRNDVMAAKRR